MVSSEIRLIMFFASKDIEDLYSQREKKKRPGADCGSDHELLITKFVCLCDYTEEVTNRFKGLDLIDRMPDGDLQHLYRRQSPKSSQRKTYARRQSGCLRGFYK